ncbi:hypothetical protein IW141_002671 [Coemansia sp. RSA 355]|nr:hypothetical protein IW141_002671 [Coemansia sp. RSA 355]
MKITNLVFALAYAAASSASTNYASSAPAVSTPQQSFVATRPSPAQPVPVTPIPIVVADFVYSPIAGAAPSVPAPAPPAADYTAKAAPVVSVTAAPANPQPQPIVSMMPLPVPAPTPTSSYRAYTNNKRDVDQSAIEGLVSGTSAMLFNANGNSYILARLPADLATKAAKNPSVLRKRESEGDLIADATTKDLNSSALLYELIGKIFARVTLPVNANVGISNPEDSGGLMRRDLLDNILGEVVASAVVPVNIVANISPDEDGNGLVPNLLGRVSATIQASPTVVASAVAPLNIVANINPDEDGNGLVPNLLGRVSATIQASPTVTAHIFDSDKDESNELMRRNLLDNILGEVVASAVAPLNIVANINPDEDGNGLVPNLLGRVSATIQASPTVTAHIFDSDKDESNEFMRRGLLESILGEVVASIVAPINIVANINPDEDGNGLVPNLLGRVSATIQASPTVTAHLFDSDKDESNKLMRRGLLESILGEVVASAVAPLNIVANINPDEDGNGLVPNLLGRVSATIQASPTVTAHLFDSDKEDISKLLKRDAMASGIYTERVDDAHIAIYVPLTALTKGQSEVSRLVSAAGGESVQIVSMTATPTVQTSSAPTPAVTSIANSNIFLRIVVPSSKLM